MFSVTSSCCANCFYTSMRKGLHCAVSTASSVLSPVLFILRYDPQCKGQANLTVKDNFRTPHWPHTGLQLKPLITNSAEQYFRTLASCSNWMGNNYV